MLKLFENVFLSSQVEKPSKENKKKSQTSITTQKFFFFLFLFPMKL